MIIGKSLTALGGGGLQPEICVTAQAGAVLNLRYKDSSIILQSYQLGADETQHTFVVSVSETAYVVEDVTNVMVDTIAVYEVSFPPDKLYLILNGNINDRNYTVVDEPYNGNVPSLSINPVKFSISGAGAKCIRFPIDSYERSYSILKASFSGGYMNDSVFISVGYSDNYLVEGYYTGNDVLNASLFTVSIRDTSELTQVYVRFSGNTIGSSGGITVANVWLE